MNLLLEFEKEQARMGLRPRLPKSRKEVPNMADIEAYARRLMTFKAFDIALHFGADCKPIAARLAKLKLRGVVRVVTGIPGKAMIYQIID